jgi:hypothetical protein
MSKDHHRQCDAQAQRRGGVSGWKLDERATQSMSPMRKRAVAPGRRGERVMSTPKLAFRFDPVRQFAP